MSLEKQVASMPDASTTGTSNTTAASAAFIATAATTTPKMPLTRGAASYLRIVHLSDAYEESDLSRVTTDLEATSTTAIGAASKIKAARADVLLKLPQHDMTYFDAFEDIAWSLAYVASQVNASEEENRALTDQADAIKEKVNELKNFLVGHAKYADINMVPLRKIGTEFGYKALLSDAGTVLEVLTQNWDKLASKLPAGAEPVQALDQEVSAFRTAMGQKEQNPEGPRQELIRRRRVNTLFRQAVANIREALIYTYGESRVGEFVPGFSNASGRSSSRNSNEETDSAPEADPGAQPAQATVNSPLRPSGFVVNNPLNLPITSPFIEDDDTNKRSA